MNKRTVKLNCPLCGKRYFIVRLYEDVPKQKFDRQCPSCGTVYDITITTKDYGLLVPGLIIDTIEWVY